MKFDIKPYMVESEVIPTKLRLMVEDTNITIQYNKIGNMLWEFDLYEVTSEEQAKSIVEQIANMMCNQSYDHGAEWRGTDIKMIECTINNFIKSATFNVQFRIKDSY